MTGLKQGTLTWVNVTSLGVAIAISGNFSGWNYGLGEGGFGGMWVAALAMCLLFLCLTRCLAEMAGALPSEADFDGYARFSLGPLAAYACGMSVAIALAVGSGLALSFIEAYTSASFGVGGWVVKLAMMTLVICFQIRGARDTVAVTMTAGTIALVVLIAFCVFVVPTIDARHWIAERSAGINRYLPHGVSGAFHCIPYALFLFLGVEQAAHAASEMRDGAGSLPKALAAAVGTAAVIGLSVLLLACGSGAANLSESADPLLAVLGSHPGRPGTPLLSSVVGIGAICSLLATFFSLIYAGSRQFYHLAVAGDLPGMLGRVNRRQSPQNALLLVALIGVGSAAFPPDAVMVVFIFLISISHLLILCSFIQLRRAHAQLHRPYRAAAGTPAAWAGVALSLLVVISCFRLQVTALSVAAVVLLVLLMHYPSTRAKMFSSVK